MVLRTYVAESMIYRTAHLLDQTLEDLEHKSTGEHVMIGEVLREYAIEGSINKIFGTELLHYVSDQSVQIMGGYGYIQGNLIERSYRDSRINRIWEGTNEINRLLITNTLLKNASEGKLSFSDAAKKAIDQLLSGQLEITDDNPSPEGQHRLVRIAKNITVMIADLAIKKLGDELRDEQEVASLIADMVIQIYAMESALLRALKSLDKRGEDRSRIQIAASEIYINDVFPKIGWMALQVLNAVSEDEEVKAQLLILRKIVYLPRINTIALRRTIAEEAIKMTQFPLSQL